MKHFLFGFCVGVLAVTWAAAESDPAWTNEAVAGFCACTAITDTDVELCADRLTEEEIDEARAEHCPDVFWGEQE